MTFKHTAKTAIKALKTNKSRSLLTILGIVIGITSIILISSLGQGAQNLILNQVQGLGSRIIDINPGKEPKGPSDAAQLFSDSLKQRDLDAINKRSNVPTLEIAMPLVFGASTASYLGETYSATIYGVTEHIQNLFSLEVGEGFFWSDDDVKSKRAVAVIGTEVKKELFGDEDAIGKKIKIKNQSFKVVGVLAKKGQVSFFNFDKVVIMPYTTAQEYIFAIKHFNEIVAEANSDDAIEQTVVDIKRTLREMHGITDPENDDFYIQTQADLAKSIGTITDVLTYFLAAVASISLFVAGIGIMNIMLVSVTERTREIGLRKALGATEQDILKQFLYESVALTATGGIIGITLGATLSMLISAVLSTTLNLDWAFTFPIGATILGLSVSALVGLLFGLYPARQASRKSPIEALRYE